MHLPATRFLFEPPGGKPLERYLDVTILAVRNSQGEIDGTAAIGVDVSEQVIARRQAEAMEKRYVELLRSLDAIVWEAPAGSDRWSFVSDRAESMLNYPREQWAAPGFWRSILHPDDRDRVIGGSGAARGDHELEYRILAADGSTKWVHDVVRVQIDASGKAVSQRGVMLDITLRKQAEIERERLQADMVRIQKLESLGVMAEGLAHDFNNMLTVILGNASLASMRLSEHSPARSAIDDLVATAQRANDLTRQLLAYSGRAQVTSESLDLGVQVREILGLVMASIPKKVTIDLDLDPLLPAVNADPAQIQQVVMNLVTNAAEAIGDENGRVNVRTFATRLSPADGAALGVAAGPVVVLAVSDTGCGMDEQTRRSVFDPFFSTRAHGRGLGLAAVHGIVRTHHGAITVQSAPHQGSTFTVYLPAGTQRSTPKPQRGAALRQGSGLILLIDDEAEVRATARAMIEALGYDVLDAGDGREGIELYRAHQDQVRLILLDMTMPVMSGEEVFRELRESGFEVPVVLSTGYSPTDARRRGLVEGLAGFLQKPYTVRQLADALADGCTAPVATE
jgi:PAS domain S-box-containing protein